MPLDLNIMIGGEAGQGVQSVGMLLAKTLSRGGYQIFADQDYESRVRGGHNFFRVRARDTEVGAIGGPIDVLVALDEKSIDFHQGEIGENGVIVFDAETTSGLMSDENMLGMPLIKLAEDNAGNKIMANTVALGAVMGLVDYDFNILQETLSDHFGERGISEGNVEAARAGYDYTKENYRGGFSHCLTGNGKKRRMLLNGNEAIALGALAAGCKFFAGYPMTPSTSIMEYLADKAEDFNLVVVQPEDEITAVNMVVGEAFTGVRAMTATSGSGFCLMVEGLGLAGITETPSGIVNGQRPGPAVGLPTRTEQGDLEFVIHAHHSEFPRAVLTPSNVEDAFWATIKAFNLAEKYQLPVIILTDHHLATSYQTVDTFNLSGVVIDRGLIYSAGNDDTDYRRHLLTDSGISPRVYPGQSNTLVVTDGDEHDEAGHLTEDANIRTEQMDKRMRKLQYLKHDIALPRFKGQQDAEITLIGWGSTYGVLNEAAEILNSENRNISVLHMTELWPFPADAVTHFLKGSQNTIVVENNATGQLAHLIRAETGIKEDHRILKYDGRPFTPVNIAQRIKEVC